MKKIGAFLLSIIILLSSVPFAAAQDTYSVVINEVCSGNTGKNGNLTDQKNSEGEYCDWIELYNPGNSSVDLSGWGITDKDSKPFKTVLPQGTKIDAKDFLIIYCSKEYAGDLSVPHIAINISGNGESITLTSADSSYSDNVNVPALAKDTTYGRYPDGGKTFNISNPSPSFKNNKADIEISSPDFSVESGFYKDGFKLSITADAEGGKIYYTTDGSDPSDSDTKILYTSPISVVDRTGQPNVICNASALSALQLFFIAVSGPLIPFILSVAIRSKNFWINYIKGLMIGISSLSFVISILGFLFDWKTVKEQDDIVRCASLLPNGVTISIIICSIGIAVAICELVRMKKLHNCHKYNEYVK